MFYYEFKGAKCDLIISMHFSLRQLFKYDELENVSYNLWGGEGSTRNPYQQCYIHPFMSPCIEIVSQKGNNRVN